MKKRASAFFIDVFFLMLYNTVVLMPYYRAPYEYDYAKKYLVYVALAYVFILGFILFLKVSPGGKIIGVKEPNSEGLSWLLKFFLRYKIYLFNLAFIIVYLLFLFPLEVGRLQRGSGFESLSVADVVFSASYFTIPFYMVSIGIPLLDLLSRFTNSENRSMLDRIAKLEY